LQMGILQINKNNKHKTTLKISKVALKQ